MKTSFYMVTLVVWVGLLLSFTYCGKQEKKDERARTNAGEPVKTRKPAGKWQIPSDGGKHNVYPSSKQMRERRTQHENKTNSANDGIDFNSTKSRKKTPEATNGTRPGSTGIHTKKPVKRVAPKTNSTIPTYSK